MKKYKYRILALILSMLLLLSASVPTMAALVDGDSPNASAYIHSYYARTQIVNGDVQVYYRITGTGTMTSIGATGILIYDSDDDCVAVLNSSNTTGLMGSNTVFYSNTVTGLSAVSGERYYAIVGFKAENVTGYDTTSYMTPLIP
jgi:hypothetical protein